MPNDAGGDGSTNVARDPRAVIVIVVGLLVVLAIVAIAYIALPGNTPTGQVNTKGQNMVAIASAAFTAVASVIAAYFGVKVANLAREDAEKRGQDHAIEIAHLAGAAEPRQAEQAIERALASIARLR
jgi:heme/copper-type cytochrome/quinol oxidase subunit 2